MLIRNINRDFDEKINGEVFECERMKNWRLLKSEAAEAVRGKKL
jgi:hypothetical protein